MKKKRLMAWMFGMFMLLCCTITPAFAYDTEEASVQIEEERIDKYLSTFFPGGSTFYTISNVDNNFFNEWVTVENCSNLDMVIEQE